MSSDTFDTAEFIVGYLAEVDDHLAAARAALVTLDAGLQKHETSPKAVRELFRALHTVKGLSSMVGAEPIVDIAHELESLLRSADRSGGRLPARALDEIVRGLRAIEKRIASLGRREPLAPAPKELIDALASLELDDAPSRQTGSLRLEPELLGKLSALEQEQLLKALAKGQQVLRVDFEPSKERAARGLNITAVRTKISALGDLVKVVPRSVAATSQAASSVAFVLLVITDATPESIAPLVDGAAGSVQRVEAADGLAPFDEEAFDQQPSAATGDRLRNVVRVEVARLDEALELLSSLVVTRSRLQRQVSALARGEGSLREITTTLGENGRQLKGLRASLMRARMIPVAEMLERAPLLIRGLCRSSGKQVQLEVDAGRSELDKSVADRLFPAIVHLLRNAVDHAIESPDQRRAMGKPPEGRIEITCAASSGSSLTLSISDDGKGIDSEKVARRANRPVPTDEVELLELITRPGLSTLETATHTSGRGLGMDIVKRIVVDDLGGLLQLQTRRTQGTTFTLTVPLSVTILDAFSFVSAARTFVVPVSAVEDLVELEAGGVTESPSPGGGSARARMLEHRGETLPLFTLSTLLGLSGAKAPRPKAIIIRNHHKRFAFEVDKMLSQQEIVVRPLKDVLVKVRGVSGSTDLGDGQPTLVLDLRALLDRVTSGAAS